jgi:hypothetical protein
VTELMHCKISGAGFELATVDVPEAIGPWVARMMSLLPKVPGVRYEVRIS